jgi:DNA-binding response OmpR family regulator
MNRGGEGRSREGTALEGRRILVVEDEYYLADDIVRMLRSRGADVLGPVATLGQAERLVSEGGVDFAILDINLRGEMGYSVADRLVEANVPFLFATGYSAETIPGRFGAIPKLRKPIDMHRLVALIPDSTAAES